MWFSDYSSLHCTTTAFGACWVEAGIQTWPVNYYPQNSCNPGHNSTCLFWADSRPGGGFHTHGLYYFGGYDVDLSSYFIDVEILNANSVSSSGTIWNVNATLYQNSTYIQSITAQSKNNSMNVDTVSIGSELTDSNGAASTFYFLYNGHYDSGGHFVYETTTGSNTSTNPPPNGQWVVNPCNCSGNTGGQYSTYD